MVLEAGKRIPDAHQKMLLSILDLEKATVEIMQTQQKTIKLRINPLAPENRANQ